ncbi:putative transferase At1g60990, chloroplastic isoform X2 [Rosa chinensis]|uniref:putative transferase At1g60990, chloroplastic isoform X2 n=1 Tax=Rosa chinensis TaxID=74649 RepID=UPI001AD93FB8|nr:putative transferase At1g60990, chloroplastic isoform X2 [Rosa chinensis]
MARVTCDCLLVNPWRLYSYHPHQSFAVPLVTLTQTKKQQKLTLFSSSKTRTRALPFDLSPPPIDHDLLDTVAATAGAKVSDDGIIETFDNDDQALDAVYNGVAVVDLSHFCRIRVSGEDRIQFLHNQSTANFECLDEGQLMEELNLGDLVGQPYGTHQHFSVNGMPVTVGVGNVISEKGFSLLMSPAAAGSVWKTILSQGATPMGSNAWEKLRILQGKPAPQKELTNEYNVLEAGLWNAISLSKGCYKGQETISRLITYDGVKQRLWGISLSAPAEPGSIITVGGKKVGKLTSCTSGRKESEYFGLGYIKRQNVSEGDTVMVGDAITGTVVEVPFLAGQRPPSRSSSS